MLTLAMIEELIEEITEYDSWEDVETMWNKAEKNIMDGYRGDGST